MTNNININATVAMQTVSLQAILALIAAMKKIPALAGHAASLEGPRTRGSTTQKGLESLLDGGIGQLIGEEFIPEAGGIPGCRYISYPCPQSMGARLGAVALATVTDIDSVKVRLGAHGYEMYLDVPRVEAEMPKATTVTIILGPDETGALTEIVWTWHPGEPLGNAKPGIGPNSGVKVHNG